MSKYVRVIKSVQVLSSQNAIEELCYLLVDWSLCILVIAITLSTAKTVELHVLFLYKFYKKKKTQSNNVKCEKKVDSYGL